MNDAILPVMLGKSPVSAKKVKSLSLGVGVTEDNQVFVWGQSYWACLSSLVPTLGRVPQIITTIPDMNYTLLGGYSTSVFINNTLITCGRKHTIIPYKTVTRVGQISTFYSKLWAVTTENELILTRIRPELEYYQTLCQYFVEDNCTVSYTHRKYFSTSELVRVAESTLKISDEAVLYFVCADGRSYLFNNGKFTEFEQMDNSIHIGSPDVYVNSNGTIVSSINTNLGRLERRERFPKILSVASTFGGVIGLYAVCTEHYVGLNCDIPVCDGIFANDSRVCNKKGICVAPKQCDCHEDHQGQYCGECKSPFFQGDDCKTLSAIFYTVITLAVGLTLAVIIIISFIILMCFLRYYKRSINMIKEKENQVRDMLSVKLIEYDQLMEENEGLSEKVDRDWIIPLSELNILSRISSGSFGTVMKGTYQGLDVYVEPMID
jgi:hypothetical protein